VRRNASSVLRLGSRCLEGTCQRLRRTILNLAPDIVIHYAEMPAPLHGREIWQQGFELMKRAFPDLYAEVEDLIAADDKVALRLTLGGTHQGEFQGIAATGRTIRYVSHEFYRVADGRIAEEWICSDMASVFRQLADEDPSGK
jgi:steroid delta-isomerase-like uncharacterized protein